MQASVPNLLAVLDFKSLILKLYLRLNSHTSRTIVINMLTVHIVSEIEITENHLIFNICVHETDMVHMCEFSFPACKYADFLNVNNNNNVTTLNGLHNWKYQLEKGNRKRMSVIKLSEKGSNTGKGIKHRKRDQTLRSRTCYFQNKWVCL